MSRGKMASKIPQIVYAFCPQLNAFMAVEFCLCNFVVSCSSLGEDSAELRYVTLYIPDQVEFPEFRC